MSEQSVFVLADRTLLGVVQQIRDDQWGMEMPADFQRRDTGPVTLREVINYHAYDDAWVPDMLTGKTMAEIGADKFQGDLLGDDPKRSFARIVDAACAAAERFDDLQMMVYCSFGDFTAQEYFWQINFFRGLRSHDIARVIGVDSPLTPELAQGLWDEISPHAEEWRKIKVLRQEVPVPPDADIVTKLLGLTGRHPA